MKGDTGWTIIPNWQRERIIFGKYEPWKRLLYTIRRYQAVSKKGGITKLLFKPLIILRFRFWSAVCGTDIPLNSNLAGGLIIRHPNGIVIHPDAVIGPNCFIFQQVSIGTGSIPGVPIIGTHVDIGAGAKILGGIKIGDHVKIGANSVVISDVPDNCTVVGIPARIVNTSVIDISVRMVTNTSPEL